MNIHYYRSVAGNFGDDLNPLIWNDLLGKFKHQATDVVLTGVGTILDRALYDAYPRDKFFISLGSGTGYGSSLTDMSDPKWLYKVVRGPLSAERLGLDAGAACTDGAILLTHCPSIIDALPEKTSSSRVVFMPHHSALMWPYWLEACSEADVDFVSPRDEPIMTLKKLANARLVIADAMHAAICADCLRVPWIPVCTSSDINSFKWQDWTNSMGLDYKPTQLFSRSRIEIMARFAKKMLDSVRSEIPHEGVQAKVSVSHAKLRSLLLFERKWGFSRKLFNSIVSELRRLRDLDGVTSTSEIFERRRYEMLKHLQVTQQLISAR